MNSTLGRGAIVALLVLFGGLSIYNASWLAGAPTGGPKLLAGLPVELPRDTNGCVGSAQSGYGAAYASPETRMLQMAVGSEADAINIESEMVGGQAVITRPFAGKCKSEDALPRSPIADAASQLTKPDQFFAVKDAAHAKAVLAATPPNDKRVYYGPEAAVSALGDAPAFSIEKARDCASSYKTSGLLGIVPESCKNGAMLLTLDDLGFTLWGWPNRLLARMKDANVRVIVAADVADGKIKGLTELSQYDDIARSYNGYIWIDNIEEMGPALKR